jgi:hypothetical protein
MRFQAPNTIPTHFHFSKILQSSNLFSLFPPSIKTHHSSPPKGSFRNKYSQDSNRKLCLENKAPNDPNLPFKEKERKEVKEDPNSMALGRFHCLVALERRRRSTFSPLRTFPPTNFI